MSFPIPFAYKTQIRHTMHIVQGRSEISGFAMRSLTAIVRQMDSSGEIEHEFYQVKNLRKRLKYIKRMQYFRVFSLLICAVSMLFLFFQIDFIGKISFAISLVSLIISLIFSLLEIQISLEALRIHLNYNENDNEIKEKNK